MKTAKGVFHRGIHVYFLAKNNKVEIYVFFTNLNITFTCEPAIF